VLSSLRQGRHLRFAQRALGPQEADPVSRDLEDGAGRALEADVLDLPGGRVLLQLCDDLPLVGVDLRDLVSVAERDHGLALGRGEAHAFLS
jgi:hypothetical protein